MHSMISNLALRKVQMPLLCALVNLFLGIYTMGISLHTRNYDVQSNLLQHCLKNKRMETTYLTINSVIINKLWHN